MKLTEILGVVALVLIILRIGFLLRQPGESGRRVHSPGGDLRQAPRYRVGPAGPALITVEQLTADRLTVCASFVVTNIPNQGVPVSRPGAGSGGIRLRDTGRAVHTVGEEHARIGCDAKGFFIQEREDGTANGMCLMSGTTVQEVSITDGMIIFLGEQPIRFRIPSEKRRNSRG